MKPEQIDIIYNEECISGMNRLPDKSIDMILCDLPYGITHNDWDTPLNYEHLWQQYHRVAKDNAAIVLFAQCPFDKVLALSNLKELKYEWIWAKEQGRGFLNAHCRPLNAHETILVFSRGKASPSAEPENRMPYFPQYDVGKPYVAARGSESNNYGRQRSTTTINEGVRYPTSILKFNSDKGNVHPTQKPVKLLEYLILTYTQQGDIVLDNCMGSGSTAIACLNTHRHFIGYELTEKYYKLAMRRIKDLQPKLML